ncbi:MAG: hypothetical protein ACYTFK_01630 [Planctomycetota bacterium]|jgi:hypothetical protein
MDDIQKQHERAVGDTLISEINRKQRKQYVFSRRGNQGPDLIYCENHSEISIEVVSCYYDMYDAKVKWQIARNLPYAPNSYSGVDFNNELIVNINKEIKKKCENKAYGTNCLLAVYILANLTTYNKMKDLMPRIIIPQSPRFKEIYLIGYFGVSSNSNVDHAIWRLFPESD